MKGIFKIALPNLCGAGVTMDYIVVLLLGVIIGVMMTHRE